RTCTKCFRESLFTALKRLLGMFLCSDVTLCSPCPDQLSILLNTDQVAQEVFCRSVPIHFAGFYANEAIARTNKEPGVVDDLLGVGPDEENRQTLAENFVDAGIAVRMDEHFVALREISPMVNQLDLLIWRQCDRNRFIYFIPPNSFRAVRDESTVTILAFLQVF